MMKFLKEYLESKILQVGIASIILVVLVLDLFTLTGKKGFIPKIFIGMVLYMFIIWKIQPKKKYFFDDEEEEYYN